MIDLDAANPFLAAIKREFDKQFPPAAPAVPVPLQASGSFLPAASAAQPPNPDSCGGGNSSEVTR